MKFSKQIQLKRRLMDSRLHEASKRLWESRDISELYPAMLFGIHSMARASVPLMKAAVDRLRAMTAVDPLSAPLIGYFVQQIPQETGHDDWLLEDLVALGRSRAEIWRGCRPRPSPHWWVRNTTGSSTIIRSPCWATSWS